MVLTWHWVHHSMKGGTNALDVCAQKQHQPLHMLLVPLRGLTSNLLGSARSPVMSVSHGRYPECETFYLS